MLTLVWFKIFRWEINLLLLLFKKIDVVGYDLYEGS